MADETDGMNLFKLFIKPEPEVDGMVLGLFGLKSRLGLTPPPEGPAPLPKEPVNAPREDVKGSKIEPLDALADMP